MQSVEGSSNEAGPHWHAQSCGFQACVGSSLFHVEAVYLSRSESFRHVVELAGSGSRGQWAGNEREGTVGGLLAVAGGSEDSGGVAGKLWHSERSSAVD